MESLETICDKVADNISDVDGHLTRDRINIIISEALEESEYTRAEFDEMFENIYECNVPQYICNAVDDAKWATENGLLDDEDDVMILIEDTTDINPEDLGISISTDDIY